MPRDFARPSTTRKNSDKPAPPSKILFVVTAVALVAFGYGLYYLSSLPGSHSTATQKNQPLLAVKPKTAIPSRKTADDEKQTNYEFYQLLPETEVKNTPVDAYTPKTKIKFHYLLQTGSFRNKSDAERQKANIAFLGMHARIEKSTANNGTWYRVQTGPFISRSKMNSAVDKMVAIGIQPLVKKIPQKK